MKSIYLLLSLLLSSSYAMNFSQLLQFEKNLSSHLNHPYKVIQAPGAKIDLPRYSRGGGLPSLALSSRYGNTEVSIEIVENYLIAKSVFQIRTDPKAFPHLKEVLQEYKPTIDGNRFTFSTSLNASEEELIQLLETIHQSLHSYSLFKQFRF